MAAVAALFTSYDGWLRGRPYDRSALVTGRAFVGLLDVQVLLGLVVFALSPLVRTGWSDVGAAMAVKELRFFSVEHITGMLIALTLAHVGATRIRLAATDRAKFRQGAIWLTLATGAVLASIPWWRPLARL